MIALILTWAMAAGIDPTALDALVKRAGELDSDALVVMVDGKVVLEKWFDGKPRPIEAMSVTKSVVALAVGRLITTGKIKSVDQPVADFYPEWRQGKKKLITIRHLLTQTTGLQSPPTTEEVYAAPDFVQLALCAELVSDPGERFSYNNKALNLVGGVVQRASGKRMDQYLRDEVFAPLGITNFTWTLDSAGNPHGMSGLQILPADLAKLGQLMLDGGKWNGKQIISAEWVKDATSPSERFPGYGYLWWLLQAKKVTLDDATLAAWRKAGVDEKFIAKLTPLRGKVYTGEEWRAAITAALKDEPNGVMAWVMNIRDKGLPEGKTLEQTTWGYAGQGWQGQHIIVVPAARLVVVRMREPSQGNTPEENEKYAFIDLPTYVKRLSQKP
jgi:CubicO group peptidase (beta-lactamase class C family)